MRKILLFISLFTLVSCGNDDDEAGRTTDPIIGTWRAESSNGEPILLDTVMAITFTYNSDNTWSSVIEYINSTANASGDWINYGTDLNSTRQEYSIRDILDDGSISRFNDTYVFNSDFSEYYAEGIPDVIYIRQ